MLDVDKIRQLIEMMVSNDLSEISLRDGEEEVNLRRPTAAPIGVPMAVEAVQPILSGPAPGALPPEKNESDDEALEKIESPMVGTFYSASDPESPPFVQKGTSITAGTVVCIVEAMKVFNEIKAEVSGTIERILAKNSDAVEFGQPLFLVRPD